MYQYILFDLDGTLTDPKQGITASVQYALHRMGIEEPDLDKLEPFIGPPLLDSFHEFYGFDEEQGQQAVVYYRERFSVTGLFENEVYSGMEHFGLDTYFDVVVGSELDGTRAKKEEVVEEALRLLLPEELFRGIMEVKGEKSSKKYDTVVMVGDRQFDVEGAKAFHIASVGVNYGYAAPGELSTAGADVVVGTVEELGEALK